MLRCIFSLHIHFSFYSFILFSLLAASLMPKSGSNIYSFLCYISFLFLIKLSRTSSQPRFYPFLSFYSFIHFLSKRAELAPNLLTTAQVSVSIFYFLSKRAEPPSSLAYAFCNICWFSCCVWKKIKNSAALSTPYIQWMYLINFEKKSKILLHSLLHTFSPTSRTIEDHQRPKTVIIFAISTHRYAKMSAWPL